MNLLYTFNKKIFRIEMKQKLKKSIYLYNFQKIQL